VSIQAGDLLVENSSFGSNRTEEVTPTTVVNNGGAIWTQVVDAVIRRTTFEDNHADRALGGALFSVGDLVLESSTFHANSATDGGAVAAGGIRLAGAPGRVDVHNTTFVANTASRHGGALYVFNFDEMPAAVTHTTFEANGAGESGAHLSAFNPTFPVVIGATVFSRAQGPLPDCSFEEGGTTTAQPNHARDDSCGPAQHGDPRLGPLADNGGPTLTVLPQAGSPLVDAIAGDECALAVDQRGEPRPQGPGCDIGATETSGGPVATGPVAAGPAFTG
jgi:predicted outer membrane repeat protein